MRKIQVGPKDTKEHQHGGADLTPAPTLNSVTYQREKRRKQGKILAYLT
jgi:hypothetical protein